LPISWSLLASLTLQVQLINNDLQNCLNLTNHFVDFWDQRRSTLTTVLQKDLPEINPSCSNPLRIVTVQRRLSDLLAQYSHQIVQIQDFCRQEMQTGGQMNLIVLPAAHSQHPYSGSMNSPAPPVSFANSEVAFSTASGSRTRNRRTHFFLEIIFRSDAAHRAPKDSTTTNNRSLTRIFRHNSHALINAIEKRFKGKRMGKSFAAGNPG